MTLTTSVSIRKLCSLEVSGSVKVRVTIFISVFVCASQTQKQKMDNIVANGSLDSVSIPPPDHKDLAAAFWAESAYTSVKKLYDLNPSVYDAQYILYSAALERLDPSVAAQPSKRSEKATKLLALLGGHPKLNFVEALVLDAALGITKTYDADMEHERLVDFLTKSKCRDFSTFIFFDDSKVPYGKLFRANHYDFKIDHYNLSVVEHNALVIHVVRL
jgi:hypothetical protein